MPKKYKLQVQVKVSYYIHWSTDEVIPADIGRFLHDLQNSQSNTVPTFPFVRREDKIILQSELVFDRTALLDKEWTKWKYMVENPRSHDIHRPQQFRYLDPSILDRASAHGIDLTTPKANLYYALTILSERADNPRWLIQDSARRNL